VSFQVFSKDHKLLWVVDTKEDAERLTQGTHYYKPITLS